MKKLFLIVFSVCVLQYASAQNNSILVSPNWVKENMNNGKVVVLQVGFLRLDYEKEHLPNSRFLWPGWLAPDSPEGAMNIPDVKQANEILQGLGVSNDSHVVICHARNEVSPAARMFLMLEYLGMKGKVSFLNGGLEAWKKAGYEVTTEVPTVKRGNFKATVNPVVVNSDYVLKRIDSPSSVIVDARVKRFYDGDPTGYPRDGHIKSAKNISYQDMVNEANEFKSDEDLQAYFTPVIDKKEKEVVTYCFIGQTASVVYMAGRILGYDMKLYDGSMQEWSRKDELPMEKTEK